MQHYELVVLIKPEVADTDLGPVVARVQKLLADNGGHTIVDEALGRRKLAYPIAKATQGTYHRFTLAAPSQSVIAIDRALRLDGEVLRHLCTTFKLKSPEQLEREQAIREKIQAKRTAAAAAAVTAAAAEDKPAVKPEPEQKVNLAELDQKLEQILGPDDVT